MLERLIAPLRAIAVRVYPLSPGQRVLDLGCGTGARLECYVEAVCVVAGVDTSEAMLGRAHVRLGDRPTYATATRAHLPFPDASMDLVTATLVLHELTEEDRDAVLREVPRSSYGGGARARLMLDPIVGDHICPTRHRTPVDVAAPGGNGRTRRGHAYERIHRMEIY